MGENVTKMSQCVPGFTPLEQWLTGIEKGPLMEIFETVRSVSPVFFSEMRFCGLELFTSTFPKSADVGETLPTGDCAPASRVALELFAGFLVEVIWAEELLVSTNSTS